MCFKPSSLLGNLKNYPFLNSKISSNHNKTNQNKPNSSPSRSRCASTEPDLMGLILQSTQYIFQKKINLLNARFFANNGSIDRAAMKKPLSALLAASQMTDIATSADWSSDRICSTGSMSTLKTLSGA